MAEQEQEQNRSEEATPFKLRRARQRGMVARSTELGFLGGLVSLAAFIAIAGEALISRLAQTMQRSIAAGISSAADPQQATALASAAYGHAWRAVILLGVTLLAVVLFLEVLQLRGLVFSAHPLKPDFNRINPAKGLKRMFSLRMLKETAKNIVKLAAYSIATLFVVWAVIADPRRAATDARGLAQGMQANGTWLLFLFIALAMVFAAIDQVMVRREFAKQMRMSRRDITREAKEQEGEPRLKQRRKQLHAEFAKQAQGMGKLPGSDMLIVNPEHVAVALAYDPARTRAPTVTSKARNHFALAMKREAFRLGIPIFENRALAQELFKSCAVGGEIGAAHYRSVADLYVKLRTSRSNGEE